MTMIILLEKAYQIRTLMTKCMIIFISINF